MTSRLPAFVFVLASCGSLLSACGRKGAETPPIVAQGPVAPKPDAEAPLPAALDAEGEAKLAAAYHAIRCVLVGAQVAPEDLYRQHGYVDGPAFATAFETQARRHPDWARKAVADSLARPCAGEAPPAAPTATAP